MILVDSSAWVEFDRASGSAMDQRLTTLIRESPATIATTEPVLMELLAGAKDDRAAHQLNRMLAAFPLLRFDAVADFAAAARIYRQCRRAGRTPRGLSECLIAAVALRTRCQLLSLDRDYDAIASVMPLRLA